MPQAVLGVAFSFGIPMAFASVQGQVPALAWWLLLGNLFWVIAYDTEYAMVDRDDDIRIGIRTSALTFGRYDVTAVMLLYGAYLVVWGAIGWQLGLGWPYAPFEVPEEVYRHMDLRAQGRAWEEAWERALEAYAREYPELHAELLRRLKGELPPLPQEPPAFDKPVATRAASGRTLDLLAPRMPELLGGSADLTPSNNTQAQGMADFSRENPLGRYLHFGVREHAMGAILNGLNLHGGFRAYGGTFLVFSDYLRPALRLAALMKTPTVFVFTHDSIGLGEDGPTHQPVEHLMSLRAMPGLWVIRPADAHETFYAWQVALRRREGPTALVLTRQAVPLLPPEKARGLLRGGYVLADAPGGPPEVVLIATGSEVALCVEAYERLTGEGVRTRVVSLPSWELFERQPQSYREEVLPPSVTKRVAVEAARPMGWERWVGCDGRVLGVDRFGASAPYPRIAEELGFTAQRVYEVARELARGSVARAGRG